MKFFILILFVLFFSSCSQKFHKIRDEKMSAYEISKLKQEVKALKESSKGLSLILGRADSRDSSSTSNDTRIEELESRLKFLEEEYLKQEKEPSHNIFDKVSSSKSVQKTIQVKHHKYNILSTFEEIEKLEGITTYVLFPKSLKNQKVKDYKRYKKVLELILKSTKINKMESNRKLSRTN